MKLKDCKTHSVPFLSLGEALDPDFSAEPLVLPAGARIVAVGKETGRAILFYTLASQGLPQGDIDKLVRLAVRKSLYLTDKAAVDGLEEHALHQYGAARLADLTEEQYREMATWLRNVVVQATVPPAASL